MKNGWQRKQIGDLCEVVAGQSPEGKFYNTDGKGIPFYQGKKDFGEKFIEEPTTWTTQITKIALEGDILMSVRAPVGPVNFATDKACIGRGLAAIRSRGDLNRQFLFYQLLYLQPEIAGREGAVFASINKSEIEALPIAFVPLPEQRRIVAILDEAFNGIATAKANAEKNLQNARALFESYLQSTFTQRGKDWHDKPLASTCEMFEDGDWVESKDQSPEGIRLIQTGNVGKGVFKDRGHKARYISEATFKRLRCTEIFEGDCLISRLPDPVGRSCLLPDTGERMITAVDCTIVRFDKKLVIPSFFIYYSQSQDYLRSVDSETTGTTRNRISRMNLGKIAIPVAPLDDQLRIINKLNLLSTETQRLESIYQQKLNTLESLKKSLLHQAFTGQL